MKLIGMLQDVLSSAVKVSATEKYPKVRKEAPERYHGRLAYDPNQCKGCLACMRSCPTSTIQIHVIDRKAKQYVMSYNIGRCVTCAQCVEECKFGALTMTNQNWENASPSKGCFDIYYGSKENIEKVLGSGS